MDEIANFIQQEKEMKDSFDRANLPLCMNDVKRQCLITFLLDVPIAKDTAITATGKQFDLFFSLLEKNSNANCLKASL